MVRGTTPTFSLKIDNSVDLTEAYNVYATFKQTNHTLTKTGESLDVTAHQVDVYLSQEETLKFIGGSMDIQLNWTYADGSRACSNIVSVNVGANLIGSVLE